MKRDFGGALQRNSLALSLIVLASLIIIALSTIYFLAAYNSEQFKSLPAVEQYDNALSETVALDEWSRMKFYWSNNLSVAGLCAATFPTYLAPNSVMFNVYYIGMALVYNYNVYGPVAMLVFAGIIFVHGVLELTGFFIIGAASLRLGWNFWGYLGRALSKGFGKMTKRREAAVKQHLRDYVAMVSLGAVMIFLAAPIETYFSPYVGALFLLAPWLALIYLGIVLFFYYSVIKQGLAPLRRALGPAKVKAKALLSGKWQPGILPFLMLILFSIMWLLSLF